MLLECVANVSEGRDPSLLDRLATACGPPLLDLHADPDHHRAVFTLAAQGSELEAAVRSLVAEAVTLLDLRLHAGVHPRFGVADVVPFVPLGGATLDDAAAARDRFATWAGAELGLPCFLYGPLPGGGVRTLPEVRRAAFAALRPDTGPDRPHQSAGACAVGARPALVAYNVWLARGQLDLAERVARAVRGPSVRALGLAVGAQVQVSCNLLDPADLGPALVYDRVAELVRRGGGEVDRAELVGLLPESVLRAVPEDRWTELDLGPTATIEARLAGRGPTTPS
ncbi:MAG TPA: hypothetical protein VK277_15785 [Acidimicrobiales bacterium]|nr:hypothetical protein [Acidimicrobiales bacterium]